MAILIDGYNLLHATGYIPAGRTFGSLEGPRREFLAFLIQHLTNDEVRGTTVVFDAAKAPAGLPHQISFQGIKVLFAHNHDEADDLIEELIRSDHVPQKLTVVSSDHRLHRAARRRRATVVDSDQWYWQLRERASTPSDILPDVAPARRDPLLDEAEVAEWLAAFGETDASSLNAPEPSRHTTEPREAPTRQPSSEQENPFPPDYAKDIVEEASEAIFPPGYGEDLLEDEEDNG